MSRRTTNPQLTPTRAWPLLAAGLIGIFGVVSSPAIAQQNCPEPSGSGSVEIYCYDALGRLTEQRRNDNASAEIVYDDAGNRTSRTETAGTARVVVVIIGGRPFLITLP